MKTDTLRHYTQSILFTVQSLEEHKMSNDANDNNDALDSIIEDCNNIIKEANALYDNKAFEEKYKNL